MSVMTYRPSEFTAEGRAYIELEERCRELEREIEAQKKREMKARCTRCGHTLFSTADSAREQQ